MKKIIYVFTLVSLLWSCKTTFNPNHIDKVQVSLDLNMVTNDRLMVTVVPPTINTEKTTYYIPKIIPGTYSENDYGQFIENFKAYDNGGNALSVAKMDENSWVINNAKSLAKITYYVNGTFDKEDTHKVFSPAGTNIMKGENFLINTHGFFGYFTEKSEIPYVVNITHPESLWAATSMEDKDPDDTKDIFIANKYAELVDNPIMYSKPNHTNFTVDGTEILISVYSPNNIYTSESISADMKRMISAQKKYLKGFDTPKKYSILLYLSDINKKDAKGFGALEHNTSTTVVFPEVMQKDQLIKVMTDVVSHEFFHTLTPLSIHSKEIHYFDFNAPKMSQHLWLYEGVTEYFANLFQVNQGLISENEFYEKIMEKIKDSHQHNDTMSFTEMSKNVLKKPYKDNYGNVYAKGALIAMCIDIELRELSNGKRGILDLMQQLSVIYGKDKPFSDDELFDKITALTYPEINTFLQTYVIGKTPIPYKKYFAKVGLTLLDKMMPGNIFLKNKTHCITADMQTKEIIVIPNIPLSEFMNTIGIKGGDIIISIDDIKYNLDNTYEMIAKSMSIKDNDSISIVVKRDEKELRLKGKAKVPMEKIEILKAVDKSKNMLKESWLKG